MPRLKKNALIIAHDNSISTHATRIDIPDTEMITPQMMDMRKMIDAAITEQDWIDIFGVYRRLAISGDRKAAEFIAKYRFGLPAQMGSQNEKDVSGITVLEIVKTTVSREDSEIIDGDS